MSNKTLLITAGFFGATAVILGALGAHALKVLLTPDSLASFKTGVHYHLIHSFMFLILLALKYKIAPSLSKAIYFLFLFGIIFFSFSIYILSTNRIHQLDLNWLGPITPIGGLLMISGWILFIFAGVRSTTSNK